MTPQGVLSGGLDDPIPVTKEMIREMLEYISSYSFYAFEEEIRQGFITIPGGHRIGLAGRAVTEGGAVKTIRHISFKYPAVSSGSRMRRKAAALFISGWKNQEYAADFPSPCRQNHSAAGSDPAGFRRKCVWGGS